jgi:hypothetical protein
MLSIVDVCDSSTSAFPGTMQSQTCIVACGYPEAGRSGLQFSTDGTTWNNLNTPLTAGYDIAFDGTQNWVAIGAGGAATSSTGNAWTPIDSYNALRTGGYPLAGVCYSYSNAAWYAVGSDVCGRNVILKTKPYDLQSWMYAATDPSSSYFGYNAAVADYGGHAATTIATDGGNMIVAGGFSSDGTDLSDSYPTSAILYAYTSNDSRWCNAISFETGDILTGGVSCIVYNGDYWLASLNGGIAISRDGITWKRAASLGGAAVTAVEWNGQYWLAATDGGYVWTSYDGYIWKYMLPYAVGHAFSLGWNGLRWTIGGYALGFSGVDTLQTLKPTDAAWATATSYELPRTVALFGQVNNFANRTLLPNSPLLPPAAIPAPLPLPL